MSPVIPRADVSYIRSHPPMIEITTITIAVQSMTAASETQAILRRRRYLRMRWSLYICLWCRLDGRHKVHSRKACDLPPSRPAGHDLSVTDLPIHRRHSRRAVDDDRQR